MTCFIAEVAGAPTCQEPSDLHSKFLSINGGNDYRTLFFTEGWNKVTLEIDFQTLVFHGVDKTQSSCPSTFLKGDFPLMVRNSCPWYLQKTPYNAEVYPRELYTANSKCQKCIGSNGDQNCERVQHKIKTLKRTGCQNGKYEYEETDTYVTIAFVCAQQREVVNGNPVSPPADDGPPTM